MNNPFTDMRGRVKESMKREGNRRSLRERAASKRKPMLFMIIVPFVLLFVLEGIILLGGVFGQGVAKKLQDNTKEIVNSRATTRRHVLETTMTNQWSDLLIAYNEIDWSMETILQEEGVTAEQLLADTELSQRFLTEAGKELMNLVQIHHTSGAFLLLNTEDLKEAKLTNSRRSIQGLYLRDQIQTGSQETKHTPNFQLLRAPLPVSRSLQLTTAYNYRTSFTLGEGVEPYYDFFYKPMEAALHHSDQVFWEELGYWSAPYTLDGDTEMAIAYSIPLIGADGTVYGVMGVEILLSYLGEYLDAQELDESGQGAYFLAYQENPESSGYDSFILSDQKGCHLLTDSKELGDQDFYLYREQVSIMNPSDIYGTGVWWLGAILPNKVMNSFTDGLLLSTGIFAALVLCLGILGSVLIAFWVQRPMHDVAMKLRTQDTGAAIEIAPTGIQEIDEITEALGAISKRLIKERENIRYERDHDFLTGLYNRRAFDREMKLLLEEQDGSNGVGAYMMMDLDNLKLVNDTYGHEYGDRYILKAAQAMRDAIRDEGLYSRVSGDEFTVFIYRRDGNRKKIEGTIAKMSNSLYASYIDLPGGKKQMIRISGGISWYPEEGKTTSELAKKADLAMYVVKRASKEQIRRSRSAKKEI